MPRLHKGHKDPVHDMAIGSVDKEWKQMARLALQVRADVKDPTWIEEQERKFIGIYKRLLTDPIEYVQREARR